MLEPGSCMQTTGRQVIFRGDKPRCMMPTSKLVWLSWLNTSNVEVNGRLSLWCVYQSQYSVANKRNIVIILLPVIPESIHYQQRSCLSIVQASTCIASQINPKSVTVQL